MNRIQNIEDSLTFIHELRHALDITIRTIDDHETTSAALREIVTKWEERWDMLKLNNNSGISNIEVLIKDTETNVPIPKYDECYDSHRKLHQQQVMGDPSIVYEYVFEIEDKIHAEKEGGER